MDMQESRIRAVVVAPSGERTTVDAHHIILELGEGREVRIDIHPAVPERFRLLTGFPPEDGGELAHQCWFTIEPGAMNVVHVSVHH